MIAFDTKRGYFNFRVGAVCIEDGYVLLQGTEENDLWTLPGGRCEMMEPSVEALRRELREELEVEVMVERLMWVVENFFEFGGKPFHELGLYYLAELPAGHRYGSRDTVYRAWETNLVITFRWFRLEDLHTIALVPSFLIQALQQLPEHIERIEHRDLPADMGSEG
jgi:ADP-ribose pyrophosphatase YjhB (NUDIX family)